MISRYSVSLNGVDLASLDDNLLIMDISDSDPGYNHETFTRGNRQGARVYKNYKEKAGVEITFALRHYDIAARQEACQRVIQWARDGGVLRTNDRPGQFLRCICESLPSVASALKWTDSLRISFAAYEVPYWQSEEYTSVSMTGKAGSGSITIPGSAPQTMMEVSITANATLNSITLQVGSTTMKLTGMGISKDKVITISYTEDEILRIMVNKTSLLNKRTGSDDLIAACGKPVNVFFTADANCSVTFSARGRWE